MYVGFILTNGRMWFKFGRGCSGKCSTMTHPKSVQVYFQRPLRSGSLQLVLATRDMYGLSQCLLAVRFGELCDIGRL